MTPAAPKRGRPPDLAKRQAILDATVELLAEVGYGGLTLDAVAQRAGSNRLLIYRVWDSKVALAADALFGSGQSLTVPDAGSTVEDLRGFIAQVVANIRRPAYIRGAPGLTVELMDDPGVLERYVRPSDEGFDLILSRARERGESVGVDARTLTRIVSGTTTGLAQATSMSVDQITDVIVRMIVGGLIGDSV